MDAGEMGPRDASPALKELRYRREEADKGPSSKASVCGA